MFHWCCEHVIWDSEKNCYKITYCISTYTPNIHPQKLISPLKKGLFQEIQTHLPTIDFQGRHVGFLGKKNLLFSESLGCPALRPVRHIRNEFIIQMSSSRKKIYSTYSYHPISVYMLTICLYKLTSQILWNIPTFFHIQKKPSKISRSHLPDHHFPRPGVASEAASREAKGSRGILAAGKMVGFRKGRSVGIFLWTPNP